MTCGDQTTRAGLATLFVCMAQKLPQNFFFFFGGGGIKMCPKKLDGLKKTNNIASLTSNIPLSTKIASKHFKCNYRSYK